MKRDSFLGLRSMCHDTYIKEKKPERSKDHTCLIIRLKPHVS